MHQQNFTLVGSEKVTKMNIHDLLAHIF